MTEAEINEVKDAIALIHHLCDEDPLKGWKYEMMKAVLPLLEAASMMHQYIGTGDSTVLLNIARVINHKRPKTYTSSAEQIFADRIRKSDPIEGLVKARISKAVDNELKKGKKAAKLSKSQINTLKAQGRITEKK